MSFAIFQNIGIFGNKKTGIFVHFLTGFKNKRSKQAFR